MKQRKFQRHLRHAGCRFLREGGSHTLLMNPVNGRIQPVPRHTEISARLVKSICAKLEIEPPSEK